MRLLVGMCHSRNIIVVLTMMLVLTTIVSACDKKTEVIEKPLTNTVQIGDEVTFGAYEGVPISWKVLDIKEGKALLIRNYLREYNPQSYNTSGHKASWEECSLRTWLNTEFYSYFSEAEQARILETEHEDSRGVTDKIFLLSAEEATRYFIDNDARVYIQMEYKIANKEHEQSRAPWWLRSAESTVAVPYVANVGMIMKNESYSIDVRMGIRPAMWVLLETKA